MEQPNDLLRKARMRRPSTSGSGRASSRQELAEAVNARVFATTGRVACLDGNYVGKLERGRHRWPGADYRAAFRAVLGAVSDAELGFYIRRQPPVGKPAVAPVPAVGPVPVDGPAAVDGPGAVGPDGDRAALRLVVVPGTAITVAVGSVRLHIEATSGRTAMAGAGGAAARRAAVVAAAAGVYTLERRAG
ncbi:hypothetical protein [Polymorphospora rubra]|uniref:Uncharacterized protein n=1 Tax=Polymorphospora rubra TaxID=338584 RepID=A0A810MZ52_9ACTN|nr:hypothetical protein Prubr_34570 [Polymorphospora rubra]